jgi:DNA-binding transcriptional ArsR family regulator
LSEQKSLIVELQLGELKHTAKGSPDQVLQEVVSFVSRVIPAYDAASKLLYIPEYRAIVDSLSKVLRITPDGQVLLLQEDLPAEKAITAVLLGAHVSNKFQKRPSDELYAEEIARSVGKALKTVRNTIAELQKQGIIERAARGTYRIATAGIMKTEQELQGSRTGLEGGVPQQD